MTANRFQAPFWSIIRASLHNSVSLFGSSIPKFYATFITEMVKAGQNLKAIGGYCGTSVAMIEADYCGTLKLDATKMPQQTPNYLKIWLRGRDLNPSELLLLRTSNC